MGIIKRKNKTFSLTEEQLQMTFEREGPGDVTKNSTSAPRNVLKGVEPTSQKRIVLEKIKLPARKQVTRKVPEALDGHGEVEVSDAYDIEPERSQSSGSFAMPPVVESTEDLMAEERAAHQRDLQLHYQRGYEQGLKDGEARASGQATEIFAVINEAVEEKNRIIRNATDGILQFALKVAEEIVKKAVELDDALLRQVVEEAMTHISEAEKLTIRANRADIPALKTALPHFESLLPGLRNILVQEDPSIERGGVSLETDLGFIDSTLKTKMEIIRKVIEKEQSRDKRPT